MSQSLSFSTYALIHIFHSIPNTHQKEKAAITSNLNGRERRPVFLTLTLIFKTRERKH